MKKTAIVAFLLIALSVGSAEARDEVRIVGSSAVVPFIQTLAENFSAAGNQSPSVEITGTGNGFRVFCSGIGYEHPDISATPRPMTDAEMAQCKKNGVAEITEMIIGLDGLVLANIRTSPQYDFSTANLFAALAEEVEIGAEIKKNPHKKWNEIDSSLPDQSIKVMGPPYASVFYYAFVELVMEEGGASFPKIAALDEPRRHAVSRTLRKDGVYVEHPRNENYILKWLKEHSEAFGIMPFSLFSDYAGVLKANRINGVGPAPDTIAAGSYPLSRPIYLYVKSKHVDAVKDLQKFLYECTSERAIGPEGYLSETGFMALDDRGRNQARNLALSLEAMSR
jgi:phosphate transport system substrate-binding protein